MLHVDWDLERTVDAYPSLYNQSLGTMIEAPVATEHFLAIFHQGIGVPNLLGRNSNDISNARAACMSDSSPYPNVALGIKFHSLACSQGSNICLARRQG